MMILLEGEKVPMEVGFVGNGEVGITLQAELSPMERPQGSLGCGCQRERRLQVQVVPDDAVNFNLQARVNAKLHVRLRLHVANF